MSMSAVKDRPAGSGRERARQALEQLKSYLQVQPESPRMSLVVAEGDTRTLEVSRESLELFAEVLAHMAAGEGVTVVPRSAELTTQQAADLLNVSRPYLIKLLDAGTIDYHLVGRHRRILAESLLRYRSEDDQRRRAAADELSGLTQEMGY
jgi:excisionase family DNA binding protein